MSNFIILSDLFFTDKNGNKNQWNNKTDIRNNELGFCRKFTLDNPIWIFNLIDRNTVIYFLQIIEYALNSHLKTN